VPSFLYKANNLNLYTKNIYSGIHRGMHIKILYTLSIIALILSLFLWFFISQNTMPEPEVEGVACTMDAMICPDGSTVGRTGPNCEFEACPTVEEPAPEINHDLIRINSPQANELVTSPLYVSGMARGNWFFEGSFPINVVNWNGLIIGEGYATAQGEWMTTEFVPFTGTITYTFSPDTPYDRGWVIFKKDNPSGLPEFDDALEFPIRLQ